MKEDIMIRAIGGIDDKLIEGAEKEQKLSSAKVSWLKWGSIAAAFVLVVAMGVMVLPGMLKGNNPVVTPDTPSISGNEGGDVVNPEGEIAPYSKYKYSVDKGKYATFVQGRVIADKYVGNKLEDVTVTAGWVYSNDGEFWKADEHARAEIYEIEGISTDVAVALKFTDELEAQLTTCFYVIMNPEADLTPVQPYVITDTSWEQNDGDGGVQE